MTTKSDLLSAANALLLLIQGLPDDVVDPPPPPPPPPDDHHDVPGGEVMRLVIPGEGPKVMTHAGLLPDFSVDPTLTLKSGSFPTDIPVDARVLIPAGVTVMVQDVIDTRIESIANLGTLSFARDRDTRLRVGTIQNFPGAVYDQGDEDDPIRAKCEIVFDGVLDPTKDPEQISVGLISFGGLTSICGDFAEGTSTTKLVMPIAAGGVTVQVESTKGWKVGDELQFSDDNPIIDIGSGTPQDERRKIAAIAGIFVTLDAPLTYTHGQSPEGCGGTVDHLTRHIVYSQAAGTRAHTILMGETHAHVCCARFNISGRTRALAGVFVNDTIRNPDNSILVTGKNQRGRYAVHAHHLTIPFHFDRLVIDSQHSDAKWGLSHHNNHGDVTNCNVYGFFGAGIVGEMGSETGEHSGNSITRKSWNNRAGEDYKQFGQVDALGRLNDDRGRDGYGMWWRGPFVKAENNKVHGWVAEAYSWDVEPDLANPALNVLTLPAIEGRDPSQVGKFDLERQDTAPFANNEANVAIIGLCCIGYWGTGGQNTVDNCRLRKQNWFDGNAVAQFHNSNDQGLTAKLLVKDTKIATHPGGARFAFIESDGLGELRIENLTNNGFYDLMEQKYLDGVQSVIVDGVVIK